MAGFQIPTDTLIDFLRYIVLPSFRQETSTSRIQWMRSQAGNVHCDLTHLEMLLNFANTLDTEADAKLALEREINERAEIRALRILELEASRQAQREIARDEQSKLEATRQAQLEQLASKMDSLTINFNSRIPAVIQTTITPSEGAKTVHANVFREVLSLCGFGIGNLLPRVVQASETCDSAQPFPDYTFPWERGDEERKSYEPLQIFLSDAGIVVANVTSGKELIQGLLFSQELWTLRKNISQYSGELRAEQCICKFVIQGRTDFVRLEKQSRGITRRNIQYFIEIKTGEIQETELREAFYQLIGGNAANEHRSSPVFITNLTRSHFVLFITQEANPEETLAYELHIHRFSTFGSAMTFLEATTKTLTSLVRDFLRRPTPLSTPPRKLSDLDDASEEDPSSKVFLSRVPDKETDVVDDETQSQV